MPSDSQKVVWFTPTEYDALSHGPPYLPSRGAQKKGSADNLRSAAFYDTSLAPETSASVALTKLLGLLQAVSSLHQAHHWNTKGANYYADHLLFERLYKDSVEFVDGLAEKALGLQDTPQISAAQQARDILAFLEFFGQGNTPDEMVAISLRAEQTCLEVLSQVLEVRELQGSLSPGLSNMLEGIADKHEEFVYLLQQRSGQGYSYDRR